MSAASLPDPPARRRAPLWWRRFRLLPLPIRVSTYVVVALVLALVVATLAGVVVVRRSWPQTTGTVELPGLGAGVDVVRDEVGVPQVYADTSDDLFRAQGYLAAQDRFFEMDVRRHATAGRLAELFGAEALESDLLVRSMGWRRVAERELPLLEPSTRAALDSYAAGVNAWLDERPLSRMSLEYTVLDAGGLDYRPEPWTAVDSLAWLKAMAWDLRGNMVDEVDRALTTAAVGAPRARQLWPAYPYREHAPIVRQGAVVDGVFEQDAVRGGTRNPVRPPPFGEGPGRGGADQALAGVRRSLEAMPDWLGRGDGIGSNSFVVAGRHTDTGEPLLANDPHLGVSLPGVWLQVGLHCRTVSEACPYDVAGFSFSGVPGVIIGHNADIAWGFTNLGPDVTDLYVEKVVGDRWRRGGRLRPLTTRTERFEVADGEPVEVTVRATGHGPIVSDADAQLAAAGISRGQALGVRAADEAGAEPGEAGAGAGMGGPEVAVSLAWTALRPGRTADAILALDRARDWDTFRAAVSTFDAPAQNIVYADRAGHIGYQAPGRVPIRESGNRGLTPAAGWRTDTDWTGEEVPYDGLPSVLDPREGFVVTANQAVTGPRYPYFLTDDWDRGYRSQRIRTLLEEELEQDGTVSAEDLLRIQRDDRNPMAPVLVPLLLEVELAPAYDDDGQELLADWDFTQPADSAPAAYFNAAWRELLRLTFHDELPVEQRPDGGQRWMAAVAELLQRPDDRWWDDVRTERREDRDDVLEQALLDARDALTSAISPDPAQWSWGRLHRLELRNQTLGESGIGVVERLFNRGGWEAPGGGALVDATAWDAAEGYEVVTAPSMRMVVDLGDLDASRWVALGGVSGHAFHPHYTDQTDLLLAGETLPWPFSHGAVEAAGEDRLRLVPEGEG